MFRTACFLALLTASIHAQIPAFPGAEGFGAYATGGRGGDVYYVTNLNNNGAGSLRAGLSSVPAVGRTIVFAVSGYIPVVSDTNFNIPSKVTIAGQTAPGDGVGLRGGRMLISGSDVVMRHFRIRHGKNGTGGDCLNIASTAQKTMLDHISLMFSTDENFSFFNSSVNNFTMQYSNSTWGMERHNAGGLWDLQNGSCHHTLWAHHRTRNPKARPSMLEWINNVTFHWRNEGFIMGDSQTPANWKANVRGCYYISIDDADDGSVIKNTGLTKATVASNGVPNFSLFLDDTLYDNDNDGILDGTNRGYGIVSGSEFTPGDAVGANRYYKSATPFTGATGAAAVTVDDALTGYKKVISSGAPLRLDANYSGTLRDELDTLLVDSVVNQYSILVQKDGKVAGEDPLRTNNGEQLLADQYGITNNGFGTLNGTTPPTDSDLDGMPDAWELALNGKNGIAYNVAVADHNNAFSAGQFPNTFFPTGTPIGYTLLEEYLHFMAVPHATAAKNTTATPSFQTVDLRKYTSGFANSPSFSLSAIYGGTAQSFLADGTTPAANGPIVKFTPTLDFIGRAGFNFTVSDAQGSQWTQQFALLVSGSSVPRDLVWTGGNAANAWDTTSSNWQLATGAATAFSDGDSALFDDRGSNTPTVNLQGSRVATSMTITGTKNYAFTGPGNLAATGSLTKAGETTLTLSTPFQFTGGTFLNGGETILLNGGNLGGGAIQFTGGSTLTANTGSNYLTISPDIKVSTGAVGNLNLAQRADLNGSLSGGGTFNISSASTINRVYFKGASANCTGTINLYGINGGSMNFYANGGNFNGFDNGRLNLYGVRVFTHNNGPGNTYAIGSLSGDAAAVFEGSDYAGPTTLNVGSLGLNTTFAGALKNGSDGTNTILTHLIKSGNGTLTLAGTNTYSGATSVNAGTLAVTGSLGNTAVTLATGGKLSGNGNLAGSVTVQSSSTLLGTPTISGQTTAASGATVAPGNNIGAAGVLTAAGGFSVTASTLVFDLSDSPVGNNDRISVTGGSGFVAGTNTFQVNFADGVLGAGNYKLIDCAAAIPLGVQSGMAMNLVTSAPPTTRQSFSLNRSSSGTAGGYIRLTVTNSVSSLVWAGSSGGTWDLNSSSNFTGGASGDNKFYNLDTVTFGDSGSGGIVILNGTLQPLAVVVSSNTKNYQFDGSIGLIGGTGSLTKSGAGTLTMNPGNTYSGGTFLTGGTLAISGTSPLGTGPVHISGGTLRLPNEAIFLNNPLIFSNSSAIISPYTGNSTLVNSNVATLASVGDATVDLAGVAGILSINGDMSDFSGTLDFATSSGMLRLNSNTSANDDRNHGSAATLFNLGTAGARLSNRNGGKTIDLGALEGGPGTYLLGRQSGSGATATTYMIGALNTDTTFAGTISHAGDSAGLFLIKVGTGVWTVSGNSNFTGGLSVDGGTLALPGNLTCTSGTEIKSGATLTLAGGTLSSDGLTIASGATLNGYGSIAGELLNNGEITIDSNALSVTGSVVNNGTMRLRRGAQLIAGQTFQNYGILDLLTASGALPPNLENSGIVIDSSGLRITSAEKQGNDFTVAIATYVGHTYQLQHGDSLTPASWTNVGPRIVGDGSVKSFTHSGGASPARGFYRIAVDP
ncbi:MAG: autotransporter-associated beta strand repeat-containing protein [Verrucomicrobiota bacterium]